MFRQSNSPGEHFLLRHNCFKTINHIFYSTFFFRSFSDAKTRNFSFLHWPLNSLNLQGYHVNKCGNNQTLRSRCYEVWKVSFWKRINWQRERLEGKLFVPCDKNTLKTVAHFFIKLISVSISTSSGKLPQRVTFWCYFFACQEWFG